MDIWSWICELPYSDDWTQSNSPLIFQLGSSKSILLKAERNSGSISDTSVTFSICLDLPNAQKTIWVSDTCPLFSAKPFLPLLLQLLQEIISRSPTAHNSTCPRSQLENVKPESVSWIMDSHSPESFSTFFNLVFLMRLFWLCVYDAPTEVGSLYFHNLLAPNVDALSCKRSSVLRTFFVSAGVDAELCIMRTLGYMLAKWLVLRDVGVGLQSLIHCPSDNPGFSYAKESHGFWVLKGYAPVWGMNLTSCNGRRNQFPVMDVKECVLRYALAHQQLEAVIQFEYSISFQEDHIQVNARVDNLRLHIVKLGFNKNEDGEYSEERHFPSRIRVWVGPEVGSTYVTALSLGRSTSTGEREVEVQRIVKGSFGKSKIPLVKAKARTSTRTRIRNWRWDQDADGNAAIFDAVLYDNNDTGGKEVASWKPTSGCVKPASGSRNRYMAGNRPFSKAGGLVFAGAECGEGVRWRLGKEMEGSVVKWRVGGRVWLSYWPNDVKSSYFETRSVEWCDEVDLPLIPAN